MLSHNSPSMETHGGDSSITSQPLSTLGSSGFNAPVSTPVNAPLSGTPISPAAVNTTIGDGFVKGQVRRTNITLLLSNLLLLAVGIPLIIGTVGNTAPDDRWMLFVGGAMVVLALWNFGQLVRRTFNPLAHPILKDLAQYGPVQEVAARIDKEMSMPTQSLGGAMITANWLVRKEAFRLGCVPLEQIVWIYKKVTQHYHNGIPTGKTYTVMINAQNGRSLELKSKKKGVDEVLQGIGRRVPWAIMGHTPQLASLWAKNRGALIAKVNERRQEMAAATPTSSLSG